MQRIIQESSDFASAIVRKGPIDVFPAVVLSSNSLEAILATMLKGREAHDYLFPLIDFIHNLCCGRSKQASACKQCHDDLVILKEAARGIDTCFVLNWFSE